MEDDINEILKQIDDETENLTETRNHINKNWINTAKDRGRWTLVDENYKTNSAKATRRNTHNTLARYVSDEDRGDITDTMKRYQKGKKNERNKNGGRCLMNNVNGLPLKKC